MHRYPSIILPLLLLAPLRLTTAFCPLHGPAFPLPKDPSASKAVQTALGKLAATFDAGLKDPTNAVTNSSTVSVHIYTTSSDTPLFEFHHSGANLNTSVGVKKVDSHSIWRIASISKLVTVYLVLKEVGDRYWDVAVAEVLPELKKDGKGKGSGRENPIEDTDWAEVTLGTLAGQVSGVVSNLIYTAGANALYDNSSKAADLGLPPLTASETPLCRVSNAGFTCTREQFLGALDTRPPVWRANTQPLYANTHFVILGYALESLAGKPMLDILQSLVDALGLDVLTPKLPDVSRAMIPGTLETSGFLGQLGEAWPMGGLYSTFNDLAKMGRSMLKSTFLSPNTTRAWLKPTAFISDLRGAVGRPWEIYRVDTKAARGVIDVYGKGGDYGPSYSTWFGLVPDYDVGFIVGVGGKGNKRWLTTQIADILFPALEEAARLETDAAYAGSYKVAANGTASKITLTTEAGMPGLGVTEFTSRGVDVLEALGQVYGVPASTENFRLFPTNLERSVGDGTTEVAWRGVVNAAFPNEQQSPWGACTAWFNVDGLAYGHYSLDSIVFTLGADGKVTKIRPRAFKVDYLRE
ncbi:beta-lactamase/transpeptidase-like protein [Byssothecium circinans]|uniref:Beta-lactamase/transpeptidase-like protein n=1 Tax=Byssothecium circinans TaxID=147558 RepID=A0A6A5TKP4_9PLEO|nr:beta-lactamase/transpeptidase-like protein [Byssothecium circinans]